VKNLSINYAKNASYNHDIRNVMRTNNISIYNEYMLCDRRDILVQLSLTGLENPAYRHFSHFSIENGITTSDIFKLCDFRMRGVKIKPPRFCGDRSDRWQCIHAR
jgi:hypothetical protein